MSGPDIHPLDRRSLMVMHGANNPGPSNYRDASNGSSSAGPWKNPATPIEIPPKRRPARNPYNFTNNLKGTRGNPVASRTVLATPRSSAYPSDHRPSKRSKLESSHVHTRVSPYFSGSTKTERKLLLPPNDSPPHESEPEIHEVQAPVPLRNTRRNDAEIMILDDSCDDIEQPVRTDKTDDSRSSSDPLLIQTPKPPTHPFETRPGQLHADLGQGKSRQVELFNQPVPASESDDEIQSFSSDPPKTSTLKSPAIPNGIVRQRLDKFEKSSVSISSQQSRPGYGVPALHLTDMSKTVVGQMRRKDEGIDSLGTSSSGFVDSKRYRKDGNITLPLKTWFLGHREFPRDGNESSKELIYDSRAHTLTVTSGAPPRNFFFRVDRDIDGAEITDDDHESLHGDVVVRFQTTSSDKCKALASEFCGYFKGGGSLSDGKLTFAFLTERKSGWTQTLFQTFSAQVKKAVEKYSVIRPSAARAILEETRTCADMAQQHLSRSGRGQMSVLRTRSSASESSITTRISKHGLKPPDFEAGPSEPRRSARHFASKTVQLDQPSLPLVAEPDELVLIYPPWGTGALNIMRSDLKRLGPEEYLNDTLIEFGLKLWLNELREKDPTFADQIHVFSSFFYKKLNKKNTEEGYQSVRKWTSKVDLFSKKYIIVPINENVHWYLAIIYEPGHTLKPPLTHSPSITARATRNRKKERGKTDTEAKPTGLRSQVHGPSPLSDQEPDRGISPKETTHSRTPSVTQDEEMDDGTAATANLPCGDFSLANPTSKSSARAASTVPSDLAYPTSPPREDAMDVDAVEILAERRSPPYLSWSEVPRSSVPVSQFYSSSVSKKKEHNVPGEPVVLDSENEESDRKQEAEVDDMLAVTQPQTLAQTYIFTLDSLGSKHVQAIRVLKNYLAREAKDKRGFDEVRDAIGKQVHVPAQPNTWDCGIYLLHLTKVFMSSPEHHFHLITTTKGTIPSTERKAQWKDEEVPLMREYLSSRITQLSETWKAEKAAKEEEAKKRMSEEVEAEVISSEGEVDIVQVCGDVKGTPQRKRHAARLRG